MKLLLMSDTHIKGTTPVGRRDVILETQKNKWQQVVNIACRADCEAVLQAGDLFDNPNPSLSVMNMFAKILMELESYDIKFFTIVGQHDMLMRNTDLSRTAMGLFESFGILNILTNKGGSFREIDIYGNSFDEGYSIPENKKRKPAKRILVTHDMIGDKLLYPGQELTDAESFLKKYTQFDIILCGDYHYPYLYEYKSRYIVNTGCLLRLTRDERDMSRRPFVYTVDTDTMKFRKHLLDIEDAETVFIPKTEAVHEMGGNLDDFIHMLKSKNKTGLGYMENLRLYFEENNTSKDVQELIMEVIS